MKILLLSDSHGDHRKLNLPKADLLIHSGDLTSTGARIEAEDVLNWFKEIAGNFKYGIVFIAGNHDRCFDPKFNLDKTVKPEWLVSQLNTLPNNIVYLENSGVTIEDINIWGSPITPWFHGDRWAFNKHRGTEIKETWDTIPYDLDILITHGPPSYKLDYVAYSSDYAGCGELRNAIKFRRIPLHVFGHIHEGYGYDYDTDTEYINSALCGYGHTISNKPMMIEYIKQNDLINFIEY